MQHDRHRLVVERVFLAAAGRPAFVPLGRTLGIGRAFEHALDVIGLAALGFEPGHHAVHLVVAHKGAVDAARVAAAAGHVEHVAHAQQRFGPHLVQNGAAVDLAADLKADAGRDVGLDQAGDHVHARALGGQNQVHPGGARLLCQPGNQFLDFFAHHHHQVGQLVDHHHDVRQPLQGLGLLGREAEGVADGLATRRRLGDLGVVARQVAHPELA